MPAKNVEIAHEAYAAPYDATYQYAGENSIGSEIKISHFTGMRVGHDIESCVQSFHGGALTIGNYDGVHLGHQSLLKKLTSMPGPHVVMTFDPHPVQVLQPERQLRRLFPRDDLTEQLPKYGVDLLLILNFDRSFASLSADSFLERYVWDRLKPKHIVAGYDFAFGSGRGGSLNVMREWGKSHGVGIEIVEPLYQDGVVVASRRVREQIELGQVAEAHRLLGRPFYLRGEVVRGAGRGTGIGIPTLNQRVVNETLPKGGVYASRTRWNGQVMNSVTNIGTNPTFESGSAIKVETHILGSSPVILGEAIDVELIERLRDEKKFSDVRSLTAQIRADISQAATVLVRSQ